MECGRNGTENGYAVLRHIIKKSYYVSFFMQFGLFRPKLLKSLKVKKIYEDKQKGKDPNYEGLKALIESARQGDTVYIESFSRIAKIQKSCWRLWSVFIIRKFI